jgi:hypothetical protein
MLIQVKSTRDASCYRLMASVGLTQIMQLTINKRDFRKFLRKRE